MKAKHRHELKTNELAEWISNFPEWAKANYKMIIIVCVAAVAASGSYFYFGYQRGVVTAREQLRLTELVRRVGLIKADIIGARRSRGMDISYMLLQVAEELGTFARRAKDESRAALALIERGKALRAELHYRSGTVNKQELTTQINQAKESYSAALEKAGVNVSLAAVAKLGLGLCEEELGNFEAARQTYEELVANADFESTTAFSQAKLRLETMDEYEPRVVFRPAPKPAPAVGPTPPALTPVPLRPPETDSVGRGSGESTGAFESAGDAAAAVVGRGESVVDVNVAAP
ncbi:MAG: tetratricopeptide repeat protein [Planctomycetota bacterium]|jgi:tetratricopeptide (TPR) repeat protein